MPGNGFLNGRLAPTVVPVNEHAGEYRARAGGDTWVLVIAARDGRLFLSLNLSTRQQAVRLTEFRPGMFITPDGRIVSFRDGSMEFGGISFVKKD